MERFAADALNAQHEAAVKAAIKAKVPWPEIVENYDVTLDEIMRISGHAGQTTIIQRTTPDDIRDAREEANRHGRRVR